MWGGILEKTKSSPISTCECDTYFEYPTLSFSCWRSLGGLLFIAFFNPAEELFVVGILGRDGLLECSLIPEIHGAMNIIGGKDDNDDSYPEKCWSCARGTIKASSITCYEMSMQIMTMQPRTVTMTMMEIVMMMSSSRKLSCKGW